MSGTVAISGKAALPAVVLAGGRATRMDGADKALLPLGEGRVIDHVLRKLAGQSGPIAINANGDPLRFAALGLPVLADGLPDFPGPLAGVLAAMDWAAGLGQASVITVAGDTPFFPGTLVAGLMQYSCDGRPCVATLRSADDMLQPQPIFGLWPVALRAQLRADLVAGMRKMRVWADAHHATYAPFDADGTAFFNINTTDDLLAAMHLLASAKPWVAGV